MLWVRKQTWRYEKLKGGTDAPCHWRPPYLRRLHLLGHIREANHVREQDGHIVALACKAGEAWFGHAHRQGTGARRHGQKLQHMAGEHLKEQQAQQRQAAVAHLRKAKGFQGRQCVPESIRRLPARCLTALVTVLWQLVSSFNALWCLRGVV